jgi:hypothetical protein
MLRQLCSDRLVADSNCERHRVFGVLVIMGIIVIFYNYRS